MYEFFLIGTTILWLASYVYLSLSNKMSLRLHILHPNFRGTFTTSFVLKPRSKHYEIDKTQGLQYSNHIITVIEKLIR